VVKFSVKEGFKIKKDKKATARNRERAVGLEFDLRTGSGAEGEMNGRCGARVNVHVLYNNRIVLCII
jgi:hypothetical protein